MTAEALHLAQQSRHTRGDELLERKINEVLTHLAVSPSDKKKLAPLLKHYGKMAHPFRSCVRDQIKHGLSRDMANRRCARLKDLIKGTTKWRGKGNKMSADDQEFVRLAADLSPTALAVIDQVDDQLLAALIQEEDS